MKVVERDTNGVCILDAQCNGKGADLVVAVLRAVNSGAQNILLNLNEQRLDAPDFVKIEQADECVRALGQGYTFKVTRPGSFTQFHLEQLYSEINIADDDEATAVASFSPPSAGAD